MNANLQIKVTTNENKENPSCGMVAANGHWYKSCFNLASGYKNFKYNDYEQDGII